MKTVPDNTAVASAMALGTVVIAVWAVSMATAWALPGMLAPAGLEHMSPAITCVTLFLTVAVVLAYRFPIHIRAKTKVYNNSVPLYLLAALLAPPLAAVAAGLGQATGELMMRSRRSSPWHYIATQSARWVLIALAASVVAHLPFGPGVPVALPLAAAAAVMWLGDIITAPLVLMPITREGPIRTISMVAKQAGLPEGAQYLVGLLGALVARQELWAVGLLALPTILVYHAFKSARDMQNSTRQLLESMADTVDLRDPYTGGHSRRVTELSRRTLRQLGVRGPEMDLIVSAARVHDIGKIGVPDFVLNKPGKLTDEEWAVMETHPDQGAELLARYPDFARGVDIVRHHHERWDGGGYPHRLKGTEIPFGARVVAVADSFDAMTSDRPYRSGMTVQQAVEVMRAGRGEQWDGRIVDAFVRSIADQLEAEGVRTSEQPLPRATVHSTAPQRALGE